MSTTSSAIFTGASQFSSSLAQVIQKAVSIASIPITELTAQETTLGNQNDEVTTLNSKFSALQSAIQELDSAANSSFGATVSDTSSVSASIGSGASEGHYAINVIGAGSYSTMMTDTWAAASGGAQTYQLYIGDTEYDVTGSDNSAASVAQAINTNYGSLVTATVVNVGSTASPDYRISLQGKTLSSDALDLKSGDTSLAATQDNGAAAQYVVNNSGKTVSSSTDNVTIATGVNLTLLAASSGNVAINVSRSTSTLSSAIGDFVSAYNAAVDEVAGQRGQSGGALQGDYLVSQLSQALGKIVTYYSSSGSISGLQSLGIALGDDGHLTVDSSTLGTADLYDSGSVNTFLGSAPGTSSTSGSGFLQNASNILTSIEDSTAGLLPTMQSTFKTQISNIAATIATKQAQVSALQERMVQEMSSNDAAIASLEQSYSFLSAMFDATEADQKALS